MSFSFYVLKSENPVNSHNVPSNSGSYRCWFCKIAYKMGKKDIEYWAEHSECYNKEFMQFENARTKLVGKDYIQSQGKLKKVLESECANKDSLSALVYPDADEDEADEAEEKTENAKEISVKSLYEKYLPQLESRCTDLLYPNNSSVTIDTILQLYKVPLQELFKNFFMEGANYAFSLLLKDYSIGETNIDCLNENELVARFVNYYRLKFMEGK